MLDTDAPIRIDQLYALSRFRRVWSGHASPLFTKNQNPKSKAADRSVRPTRRRGGFQNPKASFFSAHIECRTHAERKRDVSTRNMARSQSISHWYSQVSDHS